MKSAIYRLQDCKDFQKFFATLLDNKNYFIATSRSSHNDDRVNAIIAVMAEAFEEGKRIGYGLGTEDSSYGEMPLREFGLGE